MKTANIGHLYDPPTLSYDYLVRICRYFALNPDCFDVEEFLFLLENSKKTKRILSLIDKLKELKCQ